MENMGRSVIHPFGGHLCKIPVRGKIRIAQMVILSVAMVNIRRIRVHEGEMGATLDGHHFVIWAENGSAIFITWPYRSS